MCIDAWYRIDSTVVEPLKENRILLPSWTFFSTGYGLFALSPLDGKRKYDKPPWASFRVVRMSANDPPFARHSICKHCGTREGWRGEEGTGTRGQSRSPATKKAMPPRDKGETHSADVIAHKPLPPAIGKERERERKHARTHDSDNQIGKGQTDRQTD